LCKATNRVQVHGRAFIQSRYQLALELHQIDTLKLLRDPHTFAGRRGHGEEVDGWLVGVWDAEVERREVDRVQQEEEENEAEECVRVCVVRVCGRNARRRGKYRSKLLGKKTNGVFSHKKQETIQAWRISSKKKKQYERIDGLTRARNKERGERNTNVLVEGVPREPSAHREGPAQNLKEDWLLLFGSDEGDASATGTPPTRGTQLRERTTEMQRQRRDAERGKARRAKTSKKRECGPRAQVRSSTGWPARRSVLCSK
jgi:hypothetical protein